MAKFLYFAQTLDLLVALTSLHEEIQYHLPLFPTHTINQPSLWDSQCGFQLCSPGKKDPFSILLSDPVRHTFILRTSRTAVTLQNFHSFLLISPYFLAKVAAHETSSVSMATSHIMTLCNFIAPAHTAVWAFIKQKRSTTNCSTNSEFPHYKDLDRSSTCVYCTF